MIKELTCINCPMGCLLQVEIGEENAIVSVSGNTCKRGEMYARTEVSHPVRMITTTLPVVCGKSAMVSCKSRQPIDKAKIFAWMKALKGIQVKAPIQIGDVLVANVAQTGVDLVATMNVEEQV